MEVNPHYTLISPLIGELKWDETPSDDLLARQLGWMDFLKKELLEQITEVKLGFTALSICWKIPENQRLFQNQVKRLKVSNRELSSRIWELPVCYDLEFGKDLDSLAMFHRMTIPELIKMHSSQTYRLHFFGFLPGFMYLNGLPEQLHTPRKSIPDRSVEAGSVAIGGAQTGIYPIESPGGWHVIGRCPLVMFDPHSSPPVWAEPGDLIKFEQIDADKMKKLLLLPPTPTSR